MSRCPVFLAAWSLALMSAAAAVSCRPTIALADPPASAADSARANADSARARADKAYADKEADEAKLEEQLEAARKQLDAAAHQVAELTGTRVRETVPDVVIGDADDVARAAR